jgi:MoaA/NifB/PqqE/SkfB family radical SAM enzyme
VDRELSTEEWLRIINQAWHAGIPHLIFTGGEPTLREDLLDLIRAAESNGQVTGLLTDGYKLGEQQFRQQLLESGLDHLLFALSPQDQLSWEALQATLDEDLHTTVHITITPDNVGDLESYLVRCQKMGANAISLSLSTPDDPGLINALTEARGLVAEQGLSLKWDLPVPYSQHNPVSIELEGEKEVKQGSGKAWFYVEPDGDLLPSQGTNQVLGNLLQDKWEDLLE